MLLSFEATGHPRDMGRDQGRALAHAIRDHLERAGLPTRRRRRPSLAPFASGPVRGAGTGRETIRHYTHLAERIDGLARGASVPVDSILAMHTGTMAIDQGDTETRAAVALSAVGLEDSPGVTLARSLPGDPIAAASVVVRRSRPAVGFESVEVTLPWLVTSMGGVNEAGLAVCMVAGSVDAEATPRDGPSPILLVQECLQRFESIAAAVDWSSNRPAWGFATLLLADADGARATVRFAGDVRRVERGDDAPQVAGRPERLADALRESAESTRTLDEKALCPPDDAAASPAYVRLTPTRRTLELHRPANPGESLLVQV